MKGGMKKAFTACDCFGWWDAGKYAGECDCRDRKSGIGIRESK
mgnify:FL=1